MILFKSDWKKYPSAVIHYQTRNHSFLRMAQLLKDMGVENWYFHLSLLNPAIAELDPHGDNLTPDQQNAIAHEARHNPWYQFREISKIDIQGRDEPILAIANRGLLAYLWLTLNHIMTYLVAPRQHGKSTGADLQTNNVIHVGGRNTKLAMLTKDDQLRMENIDRLKVMRENMPDYMNPYQKNKDNDNQTTIICSRHKNKLVTAVPRNSPAMATNVGRGLASACAVIDEPQHIAHIDIILRAMLPATTRARVGAASSGGYYYTAFTGTAGDRSTPSGAYMYRLLRGGMIFTESLYDCGDQKHLEQMVRANSPGNTPLVNCTFSHRQLGFSDEYMKNALEISLAEGITADMDFFNVWVTGGGANPLSKILLSTIRKGIREAKYVDIHPDHGWIIRWYIPEHEVKNGCKGRRIVIGNDASEAVGNDAISLVFTDADTAEVIGASDINEANLYLYGQYLAKVIGSLNHAVIVPERKSAGMGLIDALIVELPKYGKDPFKCIYSIVAEDRLYETTEFYKPAQYNDYRRTQTFYDGCKKLFGYNTSGSGRHSRDILYNRVLLIAGKLTHINVHDENLANEIGGLVIKGGRLDHAVGKHDDMVVAWLLTIWFLTQTRNLEWYGLENALSRNVDFEMSATKEEKTAYDEYQQMRQVEYKAQIEKLLIDLENSKDDLIASRIESRIRNLQVKLKEETNVILTLDTMISDAKSKRDENAHASARLERDRYRSRQHIQGSNPRRY